jgi:N-acetylmuramic acid 6-phosphate etherase
MEESTLVRSPKILVSDALTTQGAEEFLKICEQFRLGALPTESPHPDSVNLSQDAKANVSKAIETIKKIDQNVFQKVQASLPELPLLKEKIEATIKSGKNIFLCGCGATGRLSLALETIWRHQHKNNPQLESRIISFMAGGDVALIHSVEKFEDFPEFGERQLLELGFTEGDLLISTTEGGETPFVIGATEAASRISKSNSPFFLYCNPDDVLIKTALRSKNVILNPSIHKINLTVGPMALTGSTRMQATTILMYYVGLAMWHFDEDFSVIEKEVDRMINFIEKTDFDFLKIYVEKESEIYKNDGHLLYETDPYLGISILTDTTERSPTFSLYPFENQSDSVKNPSLSYLYFKNSKDGATAWKDLLLRSPRTFHWKEVTAQTSSERLKGFDFSEKFPEMRAQYLNKSHHYFKIYFHPVKNEISFELDNVFHVLDLEGLNFLSAHLVLKVLMNNLSTTIMGRMGRYESNLMTWVRASNNKLVDRAVRYATTLLAQKGIDVPYEKLVHACYRLKDVIPRDQALVLKLVEEFSV